MDKTSADGEEKQVKLGVICLIRNEIDVIELFVKHLDALFDEVILLDHQSIDGTTEVLQSVCQQRSQWHYYKLLYKQNIQAPLMNFFIEKVADSDLDFLFFLDADEFILVKDRQDLEKSLRSLSPGFVGSLEWAYGIPKKELEISMEPTTPLLVSNSTSRFIKVVIPKEIFQKKNVKVSMGNHIAFDEQGFPFPLQPVTRLLHMPIRGKNQLIMKTFINCIGLLANRERKIGDAFQYDYFLQLIKEKQLSHRTLLQALVIYEHGWPIMPDDQKIQDFLNTAEEAQSKDLFAISQSLHVQVNKNQVPLEVLFADALQEIHGINHSLVTFRVEGSEIHLVEQAKKYNGSFGNYYRFLDEKIDRLRLLNEPEDKVQIILQEIRLTTEFLEENQEIMLALETKNDNLLHELENVHQQNQEFQMEKENLTHEIENARSQHQSLLAEKDNLTHELDKVRYQNQSLLTEKDDLTHELENSRHQIQAILTEKDALLLKYQASQLEINKYVTSNSWKITRPIRKIVKKLRGY